MSRDITRAEREGFDPSDPVTQVNSLAVSPIRPLSHLSLPLRPIFGLYFRDGNAGQDVETSQGYRNRSPTSPGQVAAACLRRCRPDHGEPPPAVQDGRRTQPDRGPTQTPGLAEGAGRGAGRGLARLVCDSPDPHRRVAA